MAIPRTDPYLSDIPPIVFSKNVVWAVINSPNTWKPAGANTAASWYLEFDAAVAAGAEIVLSWTANGVTMTAADTPDGSGNQFPDGDGGNAYVTSLVPFFQGNFIINQSFNVTVDTSGANPRLFFNAKYAGAAYNVSPGLATVASGSPGADDASLPNFMHHIEVWVFDPVVGDFEQAFTANVPLDVPLNGSTTIDIHEILHDRTSADVPVIGTPYQGAQNSILQYYLVYAQYFGTVPAVQKVYISATYIVARGGLGMQPSLLRDIVAELCPITGNAAKNLFLRLGSKNKLVTMVQPEWLTWLCFATDTISLEVTITQSDGSTVVFTPIDSYFQNLYTKVQFAVGFSQLNIAGQLGEGLTCVYYCVRVKNVAGAYITDSYNFVIDYRYREFPGYFVYENSYGAFQTLATVGKGQLEYDRGKTDAQQSLDRATAASIGDFIEANITLQQKGTVNIGYDRSNSRITALQRDFLLSHYIFLYENGVLIPIGLNTKNLKDAMDGVNVYANEIEYFYKYEDEVWTETLPQTDDSLAQLIVDAGSPVPPSLLPDTDEEGTIVVEFGDSHLSVVDGQQVYTAPILAGKSGYRISATQMGEGDPANGPFFRTADISYNAGAGSFTILVPGFLLNDGDELIIFPYVLNPDT